LALITLLYYASARFLLVQFLDMRQHEDRLSKMNQKGERIYGMVAKADNNTFLCPVQILQKYLDWLQLIDLNGSLQVCVRGEGQEDPGPPLAHLLPCLGKRRMLLMMH